jgi:hypothetical protein
VHQQPALAAGTHHPGSVAQALVPRTGEVLQPAQHLETPLTEGWEPVPAHGNQPYPRLTTQNSTTLADMPMSGSNLVASAFTQRRGLRP